MEIKEILAELPFINPNRQYWLVRTASGDYYNHFKDYSFIGIGWNEISLHDLSRLHREPDNASLRRSISSQIILEDRFLERSDRSKHQRQTIALGQMLKFAYDIKAGDVVVIPSSNSDLLSFGEVTETPSYVGSGDDCSFIKRKHVRWIKTDLNRMSLDPNLYRFIMAHQTINNVSDYATHINNTLFDFYTIGDKASLVLRLKSDREIDPQEMSKFYNDLVFFLYDFSNHEGQEIKHGDLSVKFGLQSPGTIVFGGIIALGMIGLGLFTILAGGENETDINLSEGKFKSKFKANSLLDKINTYMDARLERKERLHRLKAGFTHYDVQPNKELGSLLNPRPKKEEQEPKDEDLNSGEIQRGDGNT